MNDKEFAELTESIKQAGEIKRGLRQPSRTSLAGERSRGQLAPFCV